MLFQPDFGNDLDIDDLVAELKQAWSGLSDRAETVPDEKEFPANNQNKKALPENDKIENKPEEKKEACPTPPEIYERDDVTISVGSGTTASGT